MFKADTQNISTINLKIHGSLNILLSVQIFFWQFDNWIIFIFFKYSTLEYFYCYKSFFLFIILIKHIFIKFCIFQSFFLYWFHHLTSFFQQVLISWMVTLSSCLIWQIISFILPQNEYGCVYTWAKKIIFSDEAYFDIGE